MQEAIHAGHGSHGHDHTSFSADIYNTDKAFRAVKVGTAGLAITALIQLGIVYFVNSAGLLADALHNVGDVFTTVALWIAYSVALKQPNRRYTYGYRRAEDIAGIIVVLVIIITAALSAWESYNKLVSGEAPTNLVWGMVGAIVGVIGNEAVAQYKIKIGREINSVPLIADGQHSRMDGLTSLAALVGLIFAAFGLPIADPIAGIIITVVILFVIFDAVKQVTARLMDAIDPKLVERLETEAKEVEGVLAVNNLRARWFGRVIQIVMNIEVDPKLTLVEAHAIAEQVRHALLHQSGVSDVDIHVDPYDPEGEHHAVTSHHANGLNGEQHDNDEHDHDHDEHDQHDHPQDEHGHEEHEHGEHDHEHHDEHSHQH